MSSITQDRWEPPSPVQTSFPASPPVEQKIIKKSFFIKKLSNKYQHRWILHEVRNLLLVELVSIESGMCPNRWSAGLLSSRKPDEDWPYRILSEKLTWNWWTSGSANNNKKKVLCPILPKSTVDRRSSCSVAASRRCWWTPSFQIHSPK